MGRDRNNPDGASTYPADAADLESYREASRQIAQMQMPVLVRADRTNERLFVVGFDGTGADMAQDARERWTNVALIHDQIQEKLRRGEVSNVASSYVEGAGTRGGFFNRFADRVFGHSFEARVEQGYKQFIDQAGQWLKENPGADIRIAATGFSRGAEQMAAFTRMVHERGIQDPDGAVYRTDRNGQIISVEYTKPPLVAPGLVPQAALSLDPVGTGVPNQNDRRLPPSVVTGLQITAEDERRDLFRSSNHIDPGMHEGSRFLNVTVGGAHTNIGGSYLANGLSERTHNLGVDFLNALSDPPFLDKRREPTDPALNVVHRSEEHLPLFGSTRRFDDDGRRGRIERLVPAGQCTPAVMDCFNKEPHDALLASRLEWREPPIAPTPSLAPVKALGHPHAESELDALFNRLSNAAMAGDHQGMRAASQDYVRSDAGQTWLQSGRDHNAQQREAELQRQAEAQRQPAMTDWHQAPEAPMMR